MILVRRILHIINKVKNIVLNGREKNILCSLNMSTFSCYDSKGAITTILFQKKIVHIQKKMKCRIPSPKIYMHAPHTIFAWDQSRKFLA